MNKDERIELASSAALLSFAQLTAPRETNKALAPAETITTRSCLVPFSDTTKQRKERGTARNRDAVSAKQSCQRLSRNLSIVSPSHSGRVSMPPGDQPQPLLVLERVNVHGGLPYLRRPLFIYLIWPRGGSFTTRPRGLVFLIPHPLSSATSSSPSPPRPRLLAPPAIASVA
jgi:hypothetical protein